MKAVIFARTGSQSQVGGSNLSTQLRTLHEYANENKLEVVKEFSVMGSTLTGEGKQAFNQLVDYLKNNTEVKALVVTSFDRLTRNFSDMRLLDSFQISQGKELHLVGDKIIINQNSSVDDRSIFDVYKVLLKMSLARLSEEAKARWQRRKVRFAKEVSNDQ